MDDTWKDAFLLRDYISPTEFCALPEEHQQWLSKFDKVFVTLPNKLGRYNLLHKSNEKLKRDYKR